MILHISQKTLRTNFEIVEKKCSGHPDTIADGLGEHLSVEYSKYTLKKFGAVLHHNFDKVGLLGGASYVKYGIGNLTKPIRVLLNGRASIKFGEETIPVNDLLISWAKDYLVDILPLLNVESDLEFHLNLSSQSSPGKTDEKFKTEGTRKFWFEPRDLQDLQELKRLFSNDTSLGVGFAPFSKLENLVNTIATNLTSKDFRNKNPWIGNDIKIMGYRNVDKFNLTLCIPQIAKYVTTENTYKKNIIYSKGIIENILKEFKITDYEISINTRDDFEKSELYLTAIGTSLESGDEGLVGRGNRINGLITPMRPMSMEGAAGKNPVYHIGKIYHLVASEISKIIFDNLNLECEVFLISQSGRDLLDPWIVHVNTNEEFYEREKIESIVRDTLKQIPHITNGILEKKYSLY